MKIKRNKNFRFFARLLVLFIIVVFLDLIIGNLLRTFYFKQQSGLQYRTTYSIEKTTANLLIFGSSTANHNYQTFTFITRLDTSIYNTGRDGTSIFYQYAVLKAILKRYTPKIIILNFDQEEFIKNQESYDRLSSLLPYYINHPEIRSIIELKSPFEKFKLLSHIYPYNSSIFTIGVGNIEYNKMRNDDINGYMPLETIWNEPVEDGSTFSNHDFDSIKIKAFKDFINTCLNAKIQLFLVCTPLLLKPNYVNNTVVLGKEIADQYNLKFLDYSKDTTFLNHPELFADVGHLNDKGAEKFTNIVIDTIFPASPKSPYQKPR